MFTVQGNPALADRRQELLDAAGDDSRNYLRSIFADGFFQENPQEFIASIANEWFTDSAKTIELGLTRYDVGRGDPLNQALFFADIYSLGGQSTLFYEIDSSGNIARMEVPLERNGEGFIDALVFGGNEYLFDLDASGNVIGYSIITAPATVTISGFVWHDVDGDGEQDASEPGLEGWTVYLDLDHSGGWDDGEPTAETGPNGAYSFEQLLAGEYTVAQIDKEHWTPSWPASGTHTLTLTAGQAGQADFGDQAQPGDANVDGMVNLIDLGILATNWGSESAGWAQGDFTGEETVDLSDLGILATNWGAGVQSTSADAMVATAPMAENALGAELGPVEAPSAAYEELSAEPVFASASGSLLALDAPAVDVLALARRATSRTTRAHPGRYRHANNDQPNRDLRTASAAQTHPALALELDFDLLAGLDAVA